MVAAPTLPDSVKRLRHRGWISSSTPTLQTGHSWHYFQVMMNLGAMDFDDKILVTGHEDSTVGVWDNAARKDNDDTLSHR